MKLEEFIRIHDKNQFEIKLEYLLNKEKNNTEYNINLYLFLPYNLGITEHTYPKKLFYDDFYTYIRLITPKIDIESIIIRTKHLINYIKEREIKNEKEYEEVNYEIRILMCAYRSYLRDLIKYIKRGNSNIIEIKENLKLIKDFRSLMHELCELRKNV